MQKYIHMNVALRAPRILDDKLADNAQSSSDAETSHFESMW